MRGVRTPFSCRQKMASPFLLSSPKALPITIRPLSIVLRVDGAIMDLKYFTLIEREMSQVL